MQAQHTLALCALLLLAAACTAVASNVPHFLQQQQQHSKVTVLRQLSSDSSLMAHSQAASIFFQVEVVRGKVKDTDWFGDLSDPYVIVMVKDAQDNQEVEIGRTRVVENDLVRALVTLARIVLQSD